MASIGPKSSLRSLEMALSDLIVRQAKTTGKRYTLYDNDCLSLMVSAARGKSWMFRYSWLGKQKRMALGGYPALSLREARTDRDKAHIGRATCRDRVCQYV